MENKRETINYNIVIIGGGIAGLCAAIKAKKRSIENGNEVSVIVLEKGAEIGSHIISGAIFDPKYFYELFPEINNFPVGTPVTKDDFYVLGAGGMLKIPSMIMPPFMHNDGCYSLSLGNLCKWLANYAENIGVEIYTGMAASEVIYKDDVVSGVIAGVFGKDHEGNKKQDFEPGMEIYGDYIFFAEGARGSLSEQIISKYNLSSGRSPQKYGIGLKELWEIDPKKHSKGRVIHSLGWPLGGLAGGGGFIYHQENNTIAIGMVAHLDYKNPYFSPYVSFQKMKHHPFILDMLDGGKRISYGARAINEGGLQSIPKLSFKGGALIGCAAGFVNVPRIKGTHNAMKTGMLAAEAAVKAIVEGRRSDILESYETEFKKSEVYEELSLVKNVKPLWSRFGLAGGLILGGMDMWSRYIFGFSPLPDLKHKNTDHESLDNINKAKPIKYQKPDGIYSFDKLTSVSLTGTYHEENQPCHLHLKDNDLPVNYTLPNFDEPAQRYCPAGVYEIIEENSQKKFQINAQNCIHCKTCDIKEPSQNIIWRTPQGGEGPNYSGM